MKINLILNAPQKAVSGYVNVDPVADGFDSRVRGSVSNLDPVCDDAEATAIIADDVLDFIPPSLVDDAVDGLVKKLRHGGTLTVVGLDLAEVARGVNNFSLSLPEANVLIYGAQKRPCEYRKNCISLPLAVMLLRGKGLKIVSKSYDKYFYQVVAKRP